MITLKPIFISSSVELQEVSNSSPEQCDIQIALLARRHKEELKQTDMKLVIQLDQKVILIYCN